MMTAESPWLTTAEAAAYLKRGKRFVLRAIKNGQLRGAIIGGRRETLTCRQWCDEFVTEQAAPVVVTVRRRAG